jgi:hypothetical protein
LIFLLKTTAQEDELRGMGEKRKSHFFSDRCGGIATVRIACDR